MAHIPLKNPYDPDGRSWKELHKVSGQVSHTDYLFFKQLCPADGTINAVIATLFKNLIDELREQHSRAELEPAWRLDSTTYTLVLALIQRRSFGEPVRQKGRRDDSRGTRRVHKDNGPTKKQRAVSKGSVKE